MRRTSDLHRWTAGSIPGDTPEASLCGALDNDLARTMSNLKARVDPRFNEDDVTVLLVKRKAAAFSVSSSATAPTGSSTAV